MSILVGRKAPDFNCAAVLGNGEIVTDFNLEKTIAGKYALIFFYPLDFTFVCPSELIALDKRMAEFKSRGIEVITVSIDSQFTHNAWRQTAINDGGIGPVNFVMASDVSHAICQMYNVEHPEASVAYRASFLINKEGIVQSQMINDLPIGRNIDEIIRTFDAMEFHQKHGEVCPAGWNSGDAGMKASIQGVAEYLEEYADTL